MEEVEVTCPHCGAPHMLLIDTSEGTASYIEDCSVCCRPMQVTAHSDDDGPPEVYVEVA
ncbi:MAG: CPXCG motif-containing cysteine-rich protein [Verrucomicrobiota bacterium]